MAPALAAAGGGGKEASAAREKKFLAARAKAEAKRDAFIDRLCGLRILDPACGSGNFLYLALQAVKDIEYRAILECETLGLGMIVPRVGPEILHGIEINPFAAELARTTIWIGDIQWRVKNAITHHPRPILRKLDSIECRDALLTAVGEGRVGDGQSTPSVMAGLDPAIHAPGDAHRGVDARHKAGHDGGQGKDRIAFRLRRGAMAGGGLHHRQPAVSRRQTAAARARRRQCRGAVSRLRRPRSRRGRSRLLLVRQGVGGVAGRPRQARRAGVDELDPRRRQPQGAGADRRRTARSSRRGATSRGRSTARRCGCRWCVSARDDTSLAIWTASPVQRMSTPILTGGSSDFSVAKSLPRILGLAFMGDTKGGAFDIDGKLARAWLVEPVNANGRPNSDVLRPWINGLDLTRRERDIWIIDFGSTLGEREVALYESPFAHVLENVKPDRSKNRRDAYRVNWWHHVEPRPAMRAALNALELSERDMANSAQSVARYLVTPRVAKHRIFAWASQSVLPDSRLYAFARSDDCFFGILQSMEHTAWTLATCSWHGVGNDPTYNADHQSSRPSPSPPA